MKHWTVLVAVLITAGSAVACNIPVFRYALERWRPDPCELIVFHSGPMDFQVEKEVESLRNQPSLAGGNSNVEVVLCDVRPSSATQELVAQKHIQLWKDLNRLEPKPLPYVVMRASHSRGTVIGWQGPLQNASTVVLDSPIRRQLSQRLLSGDSIVWLLLKSTDDQRNEALRKLVLTQCHELSTTLTLPEGIGLPGSELHSEVPLFLKFTLLEFSRDVAQEQFLVKLFSGFQPDAIAENQPLLIPVFGRGRALEVLPANQVDAQLIKELTQFLCGACSCQVKESNPGFDLLLATDWDVELFGEGGLLPPPAKTITDSDAPRLLNIPPGRKK